MVYGRYNELVTSIHGDYFMVYKPTFSYHWGGPILYKTMAFLWQHGNLRWQQVEGVILALKRRWTGREPAGCHYLVPLLIGSYGGSGSTWFNADYYYYWKNPSGIFTWFTQARFRQDDMFMAKSHVKHMWNWIDRIHWIHRRGVRLVGSELWPFLQRTLPSVGCTDKLWGASSGASNAYTIHKFYMSYII